MKNKALQAIRDSWGTTKDDRDHAKTVKLSETYVKDHPDEFDELRAFGDDDKGRDKCVAALEAFRAARFHILENAPESADIAEGFEDDEWRVQAWLHHHFEPQKIGGTVQPVVRKK